MEIDAEKDRIQSFVNKGNYHAAINIALSAMNECRRTNNQAGIDHFIETLKGIVQTLAKKLSLG